MEQLSDCRWGLRLPERGNLPAADPFNHSFNHQPPAGPTTCVWATETGRIAKEHLELQAAGPWEPQEVTGDWRAGDGRHTERTWIGEGGVTVGEHSELEDQNG